MSRVLVIGGGIAGLAAAAELTGLDGVDVEVWEAADRLGGKIASSPFAGVDAVDEGADAYLTRVPHAVRLAARVGISGDDITHPTPASAMVWHRQLHDIPGGIVLGMPASVAPFVTTSLLTWRGKLRAALEPLLPPTDPDDSLGALVRGRFGGEVHDRLVDALVGSIYATDTDHTSLAGVPQLAALAAQHRSLLIGGRATRRRAPAGTGPIFDAPRHGMAALVAAVAARVIANGGTIHCGRGAQQIEPVDGQWLVDGERFDAIVLATPALASAPLLATSAPELAHGLASFETADVIMVRLALAADGVPPGLAAHGPRSGYLVPKSQQRFVTAVSFGSQKWAHWRPGGGGQILRVSLGRDGLPVGHLDDDAVIAAVTSEVGRHLGGELQPEAFTITRWHGAFPQYRPHHAQRVEAIERLLPRGLVLAGASYRGIGIPACVADGERSAALVRDLLGSPSVKQSTALADGTLT